MSTRGLTMFSSEKFIIVLIYIYTGNSQLIPVPEPLMPEDTIQYVNSDLKISLRLS